MNALRLPRPSLQTTAALLLCATLPLASLRGADSSPWYGVGPKPADAVTHTAISGQQADLTLGAADLRVSGAKHRGLLKGDFDLVVRLETDAVPAENGCNRRVQLLFDSLAPGRAGKDQFYVGIYQKTVGELAVTGGEYRAITNLVIDGKGGRIATHSMRGAHLSAEFRLVRVGTDIKTFVRENGAWAPLSQWTGGVSDDLEGNFILDNRWEARKPCALNGRITCLSGWNAPVPAAAQGKSLVQALAGLDQVLNAVSSAASSSPPAPPAPPPAARAGDRSTVAQLERAQQKADNATAALNSILNPPAPKPTAAAPVVTTSPMPLAVAPASAPKTTEPKLATAAPAPEKNRAAAGPAEAAPRSPAPVAAVSLAVPGGTVPVPAAASAPAAAANLPAALDLKLFDEDKWPMHKASPWAPGAGPVVWPKSFPLAPSVFKESYDINHLTPGQFDGLVATALAGMKLVMGPLAPEREQAMDAQWAPLFEYPCQPTLDYLRKFNPLCVQFLAAKLAFEDAAKAYDRAQADFQGAYFCDNREGLLVAAEAMRVHKNILLAHANSMTATAKAIADLGDLPNPLAHKKRARALDDEAMRVFGGFRIEPAEITIKPGATVPFDIVVPAGLPCDGVRFENLWYKVGESIPRKFYQPGVVVLRAEPWFKLKPVPGVEAFAVATVRVEPDLAAKLSFSRQLEFRGEVMGNVVCRYEDGKGRRESEETGPTRQSLTGFNNYEDEQPSMTWNGLTFTMKISRSDPSLGEEGHLEASCTGRLSFDGTRIETVHVTSRIDRKTDAPDGMRGLKLAECDLQNIPLLRAIGGRAEYGLEGPMAQTAITRASCSDQYYATLISAEDRRVELRYRTDELKSLQPANQVTERIGLSLVLQLPPDLRQNGSAWNDLGPLGYVPGTGTDGASLAPEQAELLARLRAQAGREAAAGQQADDHAREERLKFHQANIAYFNTRIEALQHDLDATKDPVQQENLRWQLMASQSNRQREKDALDMVKTGQWVHTRTAFEDFVPAAIAEEARERALDFSRAHRAFDAVNQQIALAPEADRYRLRQLFNNAVAQANGDPLKIIHAENTVATQVQGFYDAKSAAEEEAALTADERMQFAENVRTVSSTALMVLGTVATAGGGGTALYGSLTAEAAVQTGFQTACGAVDGGVKGAFVEAATSYSSAAAIFNSTLSAYHEGVLENLRAHAENPQDVAIDEAGAGWKNAGSVLLATAVQQAASSFIIEPAAATLRRAIHPPRVLTGGPVNWNAEAAGPTLKQRRDLQEFNARYEAGRKKVNEFKERSDALAGARAAGASREEIVRLRSIAEEAYKDVKADYHAKNILKNIHETGSNPDLIRSFRVYDRKNMGQLLRETRTQLAEAGVDAGHLEFISNAASKGGVGMDIDMHSNDPARFVAVNGRQEVNPAYIQWRASLVRNLDGQSTRLTPAEYRTDASAALKRAFEKVYGRKSDEVFPTFTSKDHPEAYKDIAWLGLKGTKNANFPAVNPLWSGQAGDVTGFKVNDLPRTHPALGTYTIMQEQARGLVKDFNTKLFGSKVDREKFGNETGATVAINPDGPLGKAPKAVQQHFQDIHQVLNDFANNHIDPIAADARIKQLTGGRGLPEVAERFRVAMATYKN